MLMINFFFSLFEHPLIMGLLLFLKTLVICLLMNFLNMSSWFSFILFLIYIGGILILFIYIISLISNEKYKMKKNILLYIIFMIFLSLLILNFNSKIINNMTMQSLMNSKSYSYNLNKLFNYPSNLINLFLISFLFFMLIITSKISNLFFGPLRIK